MKTLSLLAQKGGTGKTTLSIHLAVLASQRGKRVVLIDVDPQNSAGDWWRARNENWPELVTCSSEDLKAVQSAARDDDVDLLVIDTAPHSEVTSVTAARLADLALIPTRPAILDLRAIRKTVDIVQSTKVHAGIVLNCCPPLRGFGEVSIVREARDGLNEYGIPVCPVAVTQRAALSHALIDGRAVTEFDPSSKAAIEIGKLLDWIDTEI